MLNFKQLSDNKNRILLSFILILISSFLWDLSFWSNKISWTIWIAFVPIIIVQKKLFNICNPFLAGWLFGFVFFLFDLSWLKFIGVLPWILFALLQGVFIGLWVFIISLQSGKLNSNSWKQILIPPLSWVIIEWLRGQGPFGTGWGAPAYSQHTNLFVLQWASIVGPYGISGLIIFINALIAEIIECRFSVKRFCIILIVLAITITVMIIGGMNLLPKPMEQSGALRIALLQPSFSQNEKWDKNNLNKHMIRFESMVREAKQRGAELVVFPETAIPDYLLLNPDILRTVKRWAIENGIPLVVGSIDKEGASEWNALFLIDKDGVIKGRYYKRHLVPFGEYIPFPFQILKREIPILDLVGDYTAGKDVPVFKTRESLWSALICFESTMPSPARDAAQKGAGMIVVATNDAWFERSRAPYMHAAMGVFRAVENRVYFVQSANTGVSIIVSPIGDINAKTDLFQNIVTVGEISKPLNRTIYNIFGDWVVFFSVISLAALYLQGAFKK